jgi:hypothetical protein
MQEVYKEMPFPVLQPRRVSSVQRSSRTLGQRFYARGVSVLPAAPMMLVMMVSPVVRPVPVGAPDKDGRRAIIHDRRWGHDHGCRVHNHRRRRDYDRGGVDRDTNANRDPDPGVGRERQGQGGDRQEGQ